MGPHFVALLLAMNAIASAPAATASAATASPEITAPSSIATPIARDTAILRNSGSTNTAGYEITVRPDFTATVRAGFGASTRMVIVPRPQATWLFSRLKDAGPLDELPAGHCMKSASFGSTTTIWYAGHRSPDLSCSPDPAARELLRTISVIARMTGADDPSARFRRVLRL